MDKSTFQLDFEFKSIAQSDGSLILRGYAATHALDRDKEMFTPDALKAALAGYLSNPVVLLGHDAQKVIGRITSAVVDSVGVFVEALIPAPVPGTEAWHVKAYHDIKNGLYRAFSVGGLFGKSKGGNGQIIHMDWLETSVVPIPSNPTALFDVVQKSFDLNAADQKRGDEATLLRYWHQRMGEGGGRPGDFDECVAALSKHSNIDDPKALCAWIHMQATGDPPGHAANEDDGKSVGGYITYPEFEAAIKAAMTAAERDKLDNSDFGYVDSDGKGHFPLQDEQHVRSAVSMFGTHHFPDAATKKRCASKIVSRAKKYGIEVQDDSPVAQAAAGKSVNIADLKAVMAQLDADLDSILART